MASEQIKVPTTIKEISTTLKVIENKNKQLKAEVNEAQKAISRANGNFFSETLQYCKFEKKAQKLPSDIREKALDNTALLARNSIEASEKVNGTNRTLEQLQESHALGADGVSYDGVQNSYGVKTQKVFRSIFKYTSITGVAVGLGTIGEAAMLAAGKSLPMWLENSFGLLQLPFAYVGMVTRNWNIDFFAATLTGVGEFIAASALAYVIVSGSYKKIRKQMGQALNSINERSMSPAEKEKKELRAAIRAEQNQLVQNEHARGWEMDDLKKQNTQHEHEFGWEMEELKRQNTQREHARGWELDELKKQNTQKENSRGWEMQDLKNKSGVNEEHLQWLREKHENAKKSGEANVQTLLEEHKTARAADQASVQALTEKRQKAKEAEAAYARELVAKHASAKKQDDARLNELKAKLSALDSGESTVSQ